MISQWVFTVPVQAPTVRRLTHDDVVENAQRVGHLLFGSSGELRVEDTQWPDGHRAFAIIYTVDHVSDAMDPRRQRRLKQVFVERFVRPGFNHDAATLQVSELSTLDLGVPVLQTALGTVQHG